MRPTREELHQLVQHERKLKNRLLLATTRLEEAERERIWAIVAAHDAGLSIRKIAAATGLSRSRIHQLLQPTFKGVWSAAVNFAPLPLLDTKSDKYL